MPNLCQITHAIRRRFEFIITHRHIIDAKITIEESTNTKNLCVFRTIYPFLRKINEKK